MWQGRKPEDGRNDKLQATNPGSGMWTWKGNDGITTIPDPSSL
jgi:hypothetical protein